jgi:hypothetical protein
LQCSACGGALPPGLSVACVHCNATLAISRLAQAHEAVKQLAPALHAHATKPAPMVVKRRLDALDNDLPRRREWAQNMQAEAGHHHHFGSDSGNDWRSLFTSQTNPVRAVLLALVIWFVWWYW